MNWILACAGSGAFAVATFVARPAAAQDRSGILRPKHEIKESPQNFAIELRFSPYRPDIDSDPSLHGTPYADSFGDVPHLQFGIEFDWQALRIPHVGTLGPGLGFSYVSMSRKAKLASPRADGTTFSDEDASLSIYPFDLVAVFRADFLSRDFHIPLVPYVKAGMGLALWRAYTANGTSVAGGVVGKGYTLGTHMAIGVGFDLNALDAQAARDFDNAMGVNHTYFFAEYFSSDLTGFGQSNALRVGASSYALGLAFEF